MWQDWREVGEFLLRIQNVLTVPGHKSWLRPIISVLKAKTKSALEREWREDGSGAGLGRGFGFFNFTSRGLFKVHFFNGNFNGLL